MHFNQLITYFLPADLLHRKGQAEYDKLRIVVSSALVGTPLMLLFPILIYWMDRPVTGYIINAAMIVSILFSVKFWGHYRIPMSITSIVTYFIIYDWIKTSGLIYSPNLCILHMYLLAAIWTDKKYGWWVIFTNLLFFIYVYYESGQIEILPEMHDAMGGSLYALVLNCLITIFFGGFLAYLQIDQQKDQAKIKELQDQKISELDTVVKTRTEQLITMRENIANDFHDETGNMLSAIIRQASVLKLKLNNLETAEHVIDNIIDNSNTLYASSKDFLWHLNHDSDDAKELFNYMTSYGQNYYNQFDIAFSSSDHTTKPFQLMPSAALNIIYIFKEAMTNVVKHAEAMEVIFDMSYDDSNIIYSLQDAGIWKIPDPQISHYGLSNIEKRSVRNGFSSKIIHNLTGTRLEVKVPVSPNHLKT